MKRFTKKIVIVLAGLGALSGTMSDAHACPGGGGGRSYGGYGGVRHQPYHPQRYVQPNYPPQHLNPTPYPYAQQPIGGTLPNPGLGQPGQPFAGQPTDPSLGGLPPTVKKMANVRPSGANAGQPMGPAPAMPAQQPGSGVAAGQQVAANPLQSLGGSAPQSQFAPQQQQQQFGSQQPQQNLQSQPGQFAQTAPQQQPQQQVARRPVTQQARPNVQQAQAPAQQAQPNLPQQDSSSPMGEAQLSALQELGGFDDIQSPELEEPQTFEEPELSEATPTSVGRTGAATHIGNWTATLPNGSKVDLALQPNGNFSWVAKSGEKVSSFEGQYTVSAGTLTLVRSSDNQKLVGSLTPAGSSGFNFKLTGAKDAGLNFSRS
jgi:hypothetical protein